MNQDENYNPNSNYTRRIDGVLEDLELAEAKEREQQGRTDPPLPTLVPWVIEFRVIGTPEIIRVPLGARLMIGRDDERNDFYPEIDLSPYNAQLLGVSRKHARLILRDNRVTLEDLSSANGTYINGRRINPLVPTRVRDADQIKLGNLAIQVHFVIQPRADDDTMHGFEDNLNIPKIGHGEHLLILDDNKEVCAVLRMIAIQAGFRVSVAHSPEQALTVWDKGDVDGLIFELMLDDGNSLDLVDYIRQNSSRDVPIFATINNTGGYRENQALAKGVNEIIEKPLSIDTILTTLGNFNEILSQ